MKKIHFLFIIVVVIYILKFTIWPFTIQSSKTRKFSNFYICSKLKRLRSISRHNRRNIIRLARGTNLFPWSWGPVSTVGHIIWEWKTCGTIVNLPRPEQLLFSGQFSFHVKSYIWGFFSAKEPSHQVHI